MQQLTARDSPCLHVLAVCQRFQAYTPRVVPLGFGILFKEFQGTILVHIRAEFGVSGLALYKGNIGDLKGITQEPPSLDLTLSVHTGFRV